MTVKLSASPASALTVPATLTVPTGQLLTNFVATAKPVNSDTLVTVTATYLDASVSTTITVRKPLGTITTFVSPNVVTGFRSLAGHVSVSVPAGPAGLIVSLTSTSSYATLNPETITIKPKATTATFVVKTVPVGVDVTLDVAGDSEGYLTIPSHLTLQSPRVTAITFDRLKIGTGGVATGTITLDQAAPDGGVPVTMSSTPTNGITMANIVTVPSGTKSITFPITGKLVTKETKVTVSGVPTNGGKPGVITIEPAVDMNSFTVNDPVILAGGNTTAVIQLGSAAPQGGQVIALKSSDSKVVIPKSVTVPGGQSPIQFAINSTGTSPTVSTLTATTALGTKTAKLTVVRPKLTWFGVNPTKVSGGYSATITIKLDAPCPPFGIVINLTSDNAAATVPATFSVPPGVKQWTATLTTGPRVGPDVKVNLTAQYKSDPPLKTSITVTK